MEASGSWAGSIGWAGVGVGPMPDLLRPALALREAVGVVAGLDDRDRRISSIDGKRMDRPILLGSIETGKVDMVHALVEGGATITGEIWERVAETGAPGLGHWEQRISDQGRS